MTPLRLGKTMIHLPALAATLVLGALGGLAGWLGGLPLPLLLGSMGAVALVALLGWRPFWQDIHLPMPLRQCFIPIIGVAIGGSFTPELLQGAATWWPSLLALCVYVPVAHYIGYRIFCAGGLTGPTAYFGSVPGGLIESVTMGEEAGADVATLVLIQFLRLILTIVAVPLLFVLLTGASVGSAAGAKMTGADNPVALWDVAVLMIAGVAGYFGAAALRLPAAIMTGPLLLSALAHLAGLTEAVPPAWLIGLTQIVVGAGLGARFAGMAGSTLRRGFGLALATSVASLSLAYGFAAALHGLVGLDIAAVFLAFAPGGITEMSLIALSLQISVIFVTLHHVLRIVLSVLIARAFAHRIRQTDRQSAED